MHLLIRLILGTRKYWRPGGLMLYPIAAVFQLELTAAMKACAHKNPSSFDYLRESEYRVFK